MIIAIVRDIAGHGGESYHHWLKEAQIISFSLRA